MAVLSKGDIFPDIEYISGRDTKERLSARQGGFRAVVLFLRYYGCPLCQLDIHTLAENAARLSSRRVRPFVVLQSPPETLKDIASDSPLEFICDPEMKLYRAFGVKAADAQERALNLDKNLARLQEKDRQIKALGITHGKSEGEEQQLPAIFLLDEARKILYAHYASDILDMPSLEEWMREFD